MTAEVLSQKKTRIAWVDYYKAIVMVLVVLGHTTGLLNAYIYQFHMAAFFFASGYLDTTERKGWMKLVVDKFFSLWLPLFVFVLFYNGLDTLLAQNGWYTFFHAGEFPGISFRLREFLFRGDCGSFFLGAAWFVMVLLGITLLQKVVLCLTGGRKSAAYLGTAVVLLLTGYWLIYNQNSVAFGPFPLDLVFLGNFFFTLGAIFRHIPGSTALAQNIRWRRHGILLCCHLVMMWYFAHFWNAVMDWPSRNFANPLLDVLAAMNGILLIWNLAVLVQLLPVPIQRIAAYVGKNTLGILLFHFFLLKCVLLLAYKAGAVSQEAVSLQVPPAELSNRYWLPIVLFAVVGSLLLWQILKTIPGLRFLLGQDKAAHQRIYQLLSQKKVCQWVAKIMHGPYSRYAAALQRAQRHAVAFPVCFVVCVVAVVIATANFQKGMNLLRDRWIPQGTEYLRNLVVKNYVDWESGLYDDGWVEPQATLKCHATSLRTLVIEGYYPGDLTGEQSITVTVDGKVMDSLVLSDDNFTLSETFEEPGTYEVQISCDFSYPSINGDSRDLAFMALSVQQQ